jgi:hypothetical protein
MFTIAKPHGRWSEIGIRVLIGSVIASVVLALLDGYLRGPFLSGHLEQHDGAIMLYTWAYDFRYLADQAIYASTIFIVGAKFIETRSILTIGFDRLDASKIKLNGPDENNVVWIGHRYGTALEAQAIANTFAERLKESSAA